MMLTKDRLAREECGLCVRGTYSDELLKGMVRIGGICTRRSRGKKLGRKGSFVKTQ